MEPGLIADWAVWGKVPRTNSGYQVLAAHPPDRSADFNAAIHHWSPGTPVHGDQLPWITVGCATAPDGTSTIGVFLLDATDTVDRANRAIYRITHFAVPYEAVHAAELGWCALARAALDAAPRLTGPGAGPAVLSFPADDRLLTRIGPLVTTRVSEGPLWLAAAAAHLLDGTLVVTGARDWEPLELLLVLDTVAALLPFGMRSTLSAATRTSSGSEVPMRLYWGAAADSPGQAGLAWGDKEPDLGALSPSARSYHDLLIRSWTEHGGERVLRHLADAREPLDITAPDAHARAREVLAALNPALALAQEVREGHEVTGERVDLALGRPEIDPESLAVLAGRKLAGPSTDLAALAPHMSEPGVSQPYRAKLIDDLLDGRTDIARSNFESMRAALPDTREGLEGLDGALAFVIEQVRGTCPESAPDPVAEQLLPTVAPFTAGTMSFTQCLLRTVPGLAGRLVRVLCEGPDPARALLAWLRWLCDGPGSEIAGSPELPLLLGLLSSGSHPPEAHRKWAAGHPGAAARLLEAAVACGHADSVLQPGFFHGLVDCAFRTTPSADGEAPQAVLGRALSRRPAELRPETAARWDVLCVLTGLPPSGFTTLVPTAQRPGCRGPDGRVDTYAATLRAELDPRAARQYATTVVHRLLEDVLTVDADSGEGPGPAARELTLRILDWPGHHPQAVLGAVERLATRAPRWNETAEDRQWLERIAERMPRLRSALALREVHRVAEGASGTREDCEALAAQACAARRAGVENDLLCAAVEDWAVRGRVGERVLEFLEAYQRQWASYDGDSRALEEREHLESALARSGSDRRVLQHYCDHAIRRLTQRRSDTVREIRRLQHDQSLFEQQIGYLRRLNASAFRTRF
ncbi:hypothetical protein ACFYNZ_21880 [Streptomyces kebangsaanensis]|uniref:PE-PGRS family protein n=1 Tax=Streptomyces kebangsaanensis TaxID=864058 RepID=A0ABW6KW54_9ACTN